jgi:hypothetical protein
MDPLTIALLLGGGAAAVQGIGNALSNDPSQKLNKDRLEDLLALQRSGGLGLTGVEQRVMAQQAIDPVRQQATQATRRAEQLAATAGNSSGGALAAQQMRQAAVVGDAVSRASQQIALADQQKRQAQLNEIEARTAGKSGYRADDYNAILGSASQLAGPVGMAAGAPPGTSQLGALFGQQFAGAQFAPDELELLTELIQKDPAALARVRAALAAAGG